MSCRPHGFWNFNADSVRSPIGRESDLESRIVRATDTDTDTGERGFSVLVLRCTY